METTMELDDLKQAWQTLDRRLEQHNTLSLRLFRDSKLDKARSSLRPLFWGQIAQILFGAVLILMATSYWTEHRDAPLLLGSGLIVHLYGVLTIITAGITLGGISRIDYAAPVLAIQKQLARLRRHYWISGAVAGLPWWLLWMPFLIVLSGIGGDVAGQSWLLSSLAIGTGIGIAGLLATWWFHRWSHHPSRAEFRKRLDDGAAGGSIRKMQRMLDEIKQFEQE